MIIRYLCKFFIMKQLIILAIVFTVLSCVNKKAEIVEQIKAYKDSIRVIDLAEVELKTQQEKLYKSYSDSMQIDFETMDLDKLKKSNDRNVELSKRQTEATLELSKSQLDRKSKLFVNRAVFKAKIDSLELELKKY